MLWPAEFLLFPSSDDCSGIQETQSEWESQKELVNRSDIKARWPYYTKLHNYTNQARKTRQSEDVHVQNRWWETPENFGMYGKASFIVNIKN